MTTKHATRRLIAIFVTCTQCKILAGKTLLSPFAPIALEDETSVTFGAGAAERRFRTFRRNGQLRERDAK